MKLPFFIAFIFSGLISFGQVGDLIWSDEFDAGELDLTKWSYETGTGVNGDWGTGQLDRATDRVENVSFQDSVGDADGGYLVITTRKEQYIDRDYTSGRIRTADKAAWGPGHRIVTRAYPRDVRYQGQGFAFWMMPDEIPYGYDYIMWPQGGEMDIMEYVGAIPFNNLATVHYAWFWENNEWQSWNHGQLGAYYNYENQEVPDPAEPGYGNWPPAQGDTNAGSHTFHEYGIDWYSNRIEFFVDEHVYHIHYLNDGGAYQQDGQDEMTIQSIDDRRVGVSEYSNHFEEWHPFEHEMYVILSAGVGGSQYTYGGPIVPEAEFPCSVFIDWVKVYALEDDNFGLNENGAGNTIQLFPNPASDLLNIHSDTPQKFDVRIVDIAGNTVLQKKGENSGAIDITAIEPGVYLVVVSSGEFTVSKRIIKK